MQAYQNLLQQGDLQDAYQGLMAYLRELRVHFYNKFPDLKVAGSIYPGNMDYSFFSLSSPKLKQEKLKVAIIFAHKQFTFEVWLVGQNKGIQKTYWEAVQATSWKNYQIPGSISNTEAILMKSLAKDPNFNNLPALTLQIERGTLKLIDDVEAFLTTQSK